MIESTDRLALNRGNGREHAGLTVWFTGLSGAGKSTLSRAVAARLEEAGVRIEVLDADDVRQHLSRGLGFTKTDRDENVRRIAYVASLLTRHGVVVLVSAISPYREARDEARRRIGRMLEVYVAAPLEVCEARDPVGLYRRMRAGEITHIAGVDDPYEAPLAPEVVCHTERETVSESAGMVVARVMGMLGGEGAGN